MKIVKVVKNQIIKKSLFNVEQIERLINKTLKFFYKQNNKGKRNSLIKKSLEQQDNYINLDKYTFIFFK